MRCPDCKKKVHTDDVYCIWCSAPLQKGILPVGRLPFGEIQLESGHIQGTGDSRKKGKPLRLRFFLAALILLLLVLICRLSVLQNPSHQLPEPTAMAVSENVEVLDILLAQWEKFTLRGEYLTLDEATGALEILFTAENHTKYTILCGDPMISLERYQLRGSMYLELPPGESVSGRLRLETAPLKSMGFQRIRELVLVFSLFNAADASLLTRIESDPILLDRELPQQNIRSENTILLEKAGLSVWLTGIAVDSEDSEISLYILMENLSEEETFLYIKNICWEGASLGASDYHTLPPGARLLACSRLRDVPTGSAGQISLEIVTETGEPQTCTVSLTAEGTTAGVGSVQ